MLHLRSWFKNHSIRTKHIVGAALAVGVVVLVAPACKSGTRSVNESASTPTTMKSTGKGPVRLAHFTAVSGETSWRAGDSGPWSQAAVNLPIRQGAQISTVGPARAEVEFDDGSRMRIGTDAQVTLKTLYSDADGEFTQLSHRTGTVDLRIPHDRSVYEIDTPFVSVDGTGPSRYRVDADGGVRVAVHDGECTVNGDQGKKTLVAGDYLALRNANDPYDVTGDAPKDAFDDWTATLDSNENRVAQSPNRRYIPRNVAVSGDDLDAYGTWRSDPTYKEVWYPRVTETNWRPYHHGHWVWVAPYGWTWVGSEPWGWGPYHYGSWISRNAGWAWVPGPNEQCWTPGGVEWCESDGVMAWTPYGPQEVRYGPALSIGFSGGDWSAYFSIGSAAVYYPSAVGYCEPYGFSTGYVNNFAFSFGDSGRRGGYTTNNYTVNNFNGGVDNRNRFMSGSNFMPVNGRRGTSFASATAFSGNDPISTRNGDPSGFFRHGRRIGAPAQGVAPVAGPPGARPSALSLSPTRSFRNGDPVSSRLQAQTVRQGGGTVRSFADARQSLGRVDRTAAAGQRSPNMSREQSAAVRARSVLGGGRQTGNQAAGGRTALAARRIAGGAQAQNGAQNALARTGSKSGVGRNHGNSAAGALTGHSRRSAATTTKRGSSGAAHLTNAGHSRAVTTSHRNKAGNGGSRTTGGRQPGKQVLQKHRTQARNNPPLLRRKSAKQNPPQRQHTSKRSGSGNAPPAKRSTSGGGKAKGGNGQGPQKHKDKGKK